MLQAATSKSDARFANRNANTERIICAYLRFIVLGIYEKMLCETTVHSRKYSSFVDHLDVATVFKLVSSKATSEFSLFRTTPRNVRKN